MSGMSRNLEQQLGYDDDYVPTEDSRKLYNLTWNALDWEPGKYVNLVSWQVSTGPAKSMVVKDACMETDRAIRRARRSATRALDFRRKHD